MAQFVTLRITAVLSVHDLRDSCDFLQSRFLLYHGTVDLLISISSRLNFKTSDKNDILLGAIVENLAS